ncbi:SusC/RagA family protein [Parabacteroides distasonis]|uniref:SusC/RagA family protein n=1 Tax=Parabacteroides distasonis TaxID=823 RepID=A0A1Y4I8Y9_PARDI|nr:TonB-dependent receptor [Parabacteroides distasonis]OUP15490.1 SusC/RagA family protein [Parabacteroides distasonis]
MKQKMYSCDARVILSILIGLFLSCNVFAQDITIKGNVKDAKGEPIIGASILEKGTTNGTVTDFDGNFMLSAPKGSTIGISYIGYKSQDIINQGQSNLIVVLQEDTEVLDEIVVIGYGTVKKDDATGSVTAIKPDKMNRGLTTTATDMINGKIAGVNITTDGGAPGSGASIRIRGGSSLSASNNPLIVIDGLPIDNDGIKGVSNPLSTINPNDIATFTVLKDASATAIYGSRASNGVILITTKKGEKGSRPRVTYDGNVSISTKTKSIDVMGADEYRNFVTDRFGAESSAVKLLGKENTDWQKEIFRTAVGTDHNITVSGGLNNMPYRVSIGYTNQNGILKTSKFERYTGSVNLAPSFFEDHLNINFNAKGMISNNRFADTGAIGAAIAFDPTQPVMNGNSKYGGYFAWENAGEFISIATKNPVAMLQQKKEEANSKNLVGNIQVDYKFHFLPELRANLNLGMDMATGTQDIYYPKESPLGYVDNGKTGYETIDKYNHLLDFYLQYAKDFNEKHHFDIMAGYSWQHFHRSTENAYNNLNGDNPTSYIFKTESYLISFFGRVNYSFMNRYLITATLRNDGTSRFSKDNRWGLFPSVALGWKIKEEGFMKDVDAVSDLKLRLGYGITGQQDISQGDYPYMATYFAGQDGAYYQFGDQFVPIARPDGYNPNLKWEETTTWNAGFDFGFLDNRITSSLDYYYRETKDLINVIDVPAGTNFKNRIVSNIGSLRNQGVEFSINAKAISTPDWKWDLGFNVAWNNNEITKLTAQDDASSIVLTGTVEGGTGTMIQAQGVNHPANSFYVYEQVYDQQGNPIEGLYVDRNGDGVINDEDRYFCHKPAADVTMGFTSKLVWKAWDFSFSLRSNLGNYVYNNVASSNAALSEGSINNKGYLSNRPLSAFDTNFQNMNVLSDYYVQNASFLRCDNITLGYSFNKLFGVLGGRIYGTVQNPFVITKYKGLDPEVANAADKTFGIDKNVYPRPLVGILGVSLNF